MGNGPYSIKAYGVNSPMASFQAMAIELHALRPDDMLIDIMHCGICHSDIRVARSGYGPVNHPCVPGHEIVGRFYPSPFCMLCM